MNCSWLLSKDDPLQGGVISLVALLDQPSDLVVKPHDQPAVLLRRPNLMLLVATPLYSLSTSSLTNLCWVVVYTCLLLAKAMSENF